MIVMRCAVIVAVVLLAALQAAAADEAGDPTLVGRTASVLADVRARGDKGERVLHADDLLRFQEQVFTGRDSKTTLVFRDGSTLELGPDASVTIDRYVYDPSSGVGDKQIGISRGLFRFVSGAAASSSRTTIRTPVGTAGIRGSVLSGWVVPDAPLILVGGFGGFVFTNNAGKIEFNGGQSISVPSEKQAAIPPERMPPAVVAVFVQQVQQRLGINPPPVPPPGQTVRQQLARSNGLTAQQQQQGQARPPAPLVVVSGAGSALPPALAQVFASGLLSGTGVPTAQQQALLRQIEQQNPNATKILQGYFAAQSSLHTQTQQTATRDVKSGLALVLSPTQLAAVNRQMPNTSQITPAPLPEALAKAVAAGDTTRVTALIQQLSGGDATKAAGLALSVVAAAENMLATNPSAAVQLAKASLGTIQPTRVHTTAPGESQLTLVIAARIVITPEAIRTSSKDIAELTVKLAKLSTVPVLYAIDPASSNGVLSVVVLAAADPAVRETGGAALSDVAAVLAVASRSGVFQAAGDASIAQVEQVLSQAAVLLVVTTPDGKSSDRNTDNKPQETPMRYENPNRQASPS